MDDTLESLFRREYPRLVRALTLATGSEELAAEAVQDAFVQAYRHWKRISAYDDPARWLRRVALNRVTDSHRWSRRRDAGLARLASERQARDADRASAAGDEADGWLIDLHRAVAQLPSRQRMVVSLHYLADLQVDEVAEMMQISAGTVKSQLSDARRNLSRTLEVHDV